MKTGRTFPIIGIFAAAFFQSLENNAAEVRLTDLALGSITQGWGFAHTNQSVAGLPIKIGGVAFTNGIGTHAPSEAVIQLDGKATRFTARAGINDDGRREPGSVEFQIYGDGKLLDRSGVMHGGDAAKPMMVALAGVRRLRLVVTDGGDNNYSDHAVWADPIILYSGAPPTMNGAAGDLAPVALYPPAGKRTRSPGRTTYFVNPATGDDANSGLKADQAWKTFAAVNARMFAAGDRIEIAPGSFGESLVPAGEGTEASPVEFHFAPGRFEIASENPIRRTLHISNGNDFPERPKAIGILVQDAKHIRFTGENSDVVFCGTMIEFVNDHADDITYAGINFDMKRPVVSEFRVREIGTNSAVIEVAEGSDYAINNGAFSWTGDLGPGWTMVQQAIPEEGRCWRAGRQDVFGGARAEDIGNRKVRLTFKSGTGVLTSGRQFQFRNVGRDCVGGFNWRSKKLTWRNCNFHAFPGLGIVSQFTEDITYDHVNVVPPAGTIRTCPAACDMFHFSGCRGKITVADCRMSGSQDDPINVHGTHLRLVEKTAPAQVLVRFMHPQTYGFAAFQPGDRVEFVSHVSLRAFATNTVKAIERKSDKDWLLTFEKPAADFSANDVIDNVSWYPDLEVRNCFVTMDATRGFLITTRGKVLVESNTFFRTTMSAIDISDDANSWFESGPVRDVTIRGNKFIQCGGPVIRIAPENRTANPEEPVHENIRILDNFFDGDGVSAKSVKGLTITGNRFTSKSLPVRQTACTDVVIENNKLDAKE